MPPSVSYSRHAIPILPVDRAGNFHYRQWLSRPRPRVRDLRLLRAGEPDAEELLLVANPVADCQSLRAVAYMRLGIEPGVSRDLPTTALNLEIRAIIRERMSYEDMIRLASTYRAGDALDGYRCREQGVWKTTDEQYRQLDHIVSYLPPNHAQRRPKYTNKRPVGLRAYLDRGRAMSVDPEQHTSVSKLPGGSDVSRPALHPFAALSVQHELLDQFWSGWRRRENRGEAY